MQVFKAFTKIVLNRCFIALLYAGIFIAISFLITFKQSDAFDKFSGEKLTMTISDLDDTPESRELIDYLSKKNKVTVDSHPDNDKLLLNMFYQKTDFMLTIKEGYGSRISTGQTNDLFQCSYIEGSYAQSMAQNQIDKYVKTLTAYIRGGMDREIALNTASELMDTEADVTFLGNETEKQGMTGSGKAFFRYMPYIFIGMMISTLVPALMIMNGKKIKARTNASCISPSKQFMGILLGTVIYAMVVWLIFMAAAAAMFGGELFQVQGILSMINTIALMSVTLAIALLTANLLRSSKPVDMVATTVGLGMSFLCGVFVPLEYLSNGVKTFAHALPVYWYVRASETALTDGNINMGEFFAYVGIQFVFAFAILLAALLISRKKRRALN